MADTKISDLTALGGASLAAADLVPVVDVSDTSMAASGTNKKLLASALALVDGGAKTDNFTAAVGEFYRIDLSTPPTDTFTANAGTDVITLATKTPKDGQLVRVSTTTTLPGNLSASTNYWTRDSSGSTCKLASSPGGSAIDISSAGTGTHTITYSPAITFPGSPSVGNRFGYTLARSNTVYVACIDRNSSNVMGGTDVDPWLLYIAGESLIWRYDSTSSGLGWFLENDGRIPGKAFQRRDAALTLTASTFVKLAFDSEDIDRGGIGDLANSRFMPRRKNEYMLSGFLWASPVADTKYVILQSYKNGVAAERLLQNQYAGSAAGGGSGVVLVSGIASDYFELYGWSDSTSPAATSGTSDELRSWGSFVEVIT